MMPRVGFDPTSLWRISITDSVPVYCCDSGGRIRFAISHYREGKRLRRHHCDDWGEELCAEDKQANEHSLKDGTRLLSCYRTPAGDRLYIITEHDRSMTTLLLPEEY